MKAKKTRTDEKDRFIVVMAGGRGERFWPMSREGSPKQLLTLLGGRSLLQQAVERVLPVAPMKNILVITNQAQAPEVQRQLPKLPKENVIAEPMGRDTCADENLFFSNRRGFLRGESDYGRLLSAIMLEP